MKFVEFDKKNLIPTNKIVAVITDAEDQKKIILWLVGGHVYNILSTSEVGAKNIYNTIKDSINVAL